MGSSNLAAKVIRLALAPALSVALLAVLASPAAAATGDITTIAGPAGLSQPHGLAYDPNPSADPYAGDIFFSDTNNCAVKAITTGGTVFTLVNTAALPCSTITPGPAAASSLNHPHGLAFDAAHRLLYVADRDNHQVEVVDLKPSPPTISTLAVSTTALQAPVGLVVDQTTGDLYIADEVGAYVWRAPFGGGLFIAAGNGAAGFNGNGIAASSAELNLPSGLDYDPGTGRLFIADAGNNQIRVVQAGVISLLAGDPLGAAGISPDGSAATAPLTTPRAVRLDANGQVFFDETGNNRVRTLTATGLLTVAGGGAAVPGDGGPATAALLASPHSLIVVPSAVPGENGDLVFNDTSHNSVRRVENVARFASVQPGPAVPEAPAAVLLPLSALVAAGWVLLRHRRRAAGPTVA